MKKLHFLFLAALFAFSVGIGGCLDLGDDEGDNNNDNGGDEDVDSTDTNPYINPNTCSGSCIANETTCLPNGAGGYTWCICPPTTLVWSPQDCSTRCGDQAVLGCADDPDDSLGAKAVCICGEEASHNCGNGTIDEGEECEPTDISNCDTGETCSSTTCMCMNESQGDCGNGTIDDDEECEPTDLSNCATGETCNSVTCLCEDGTDPYCGDGTVNGTEECEPTDLSNCNTGETCNSVSCLCEGGTEPYCGDGTVNGTEECEPTDLSNCNAGRVLQLGDLRVPGWQHRRRHLHQLRKHPGMSSGMHPASQHLW